jgi:hypothetical protein
VLVPLQHAQLVLMELIMLQELIQEQHALHVIQFVLLVQVHQQFVQNVKEILNSTETHAIHVMMDFSIYLISIHKLLALKHVMLTVLHVVME